MSEKRLNVLTSAVVLTEEMDAYNSLRNKFLQLSKEAEAKVSESYDKNVKSYKDLQISAQYMLDRLFKEYLQIGAIHLISYGIYDVDEEVLREEYGKDFDITYKKTILNIVREINAIDADVAQGKADRKEMVADAGSTFQTLGFYRQTGDVGKDLSNVAKAETETTVETAAAEENQTVKEEGTKKVLTSKTIDFGQHTSDPNVFTDETLSVEVYYLLNENEGPVYLSISINGVASNLTGIVVKDSSLAGDPPSIEALCNIDNYFKQSGENSISINVCGTWTEYDYVGGQFVPAGTAPTTTTTTAAETTTTTTTTTTSAADLEAAEKALYEIYAAKYKPAYGIKEDVEYHIVDGVLTSATIVVDDEKENLVKTYFVTKDGVTLINSVPRGGMGYGFESTDFTCDGYQFYAQFVQPGSDGDVRSYLTIYVYDENGNLSVTNINGLTVGTCLYGQLEDGSLDWLGNYKIKLSDCLSWNGDTITINRNIAKYNDSSLTHGVVTSDSTTYTYDAATNTFVATNGTNNGSNDGKTDNGSASNAPATKNTSGTPKTGDMTTVPAVAVGLTLTAAGVVAFISKRKK